MKHRYNNCVLACLGLIARQSFMLKQYLSFTMFATYLYLWNVRRELETLQARELIYIFIDFVMGL